MPPGKLHPAAPRNGALLHPLGVTAAPRHRPAPPRLPAERHARELPVAPKLDLRRYREPRAGQRPPAERGRGRPQFLVTPTKVRQILNGVPPRVGIALPALVQALMLRLAFPEYARARVLAQARRHLLDMERRKLVNLNPQTGIIRPVRVVAKRKPKRAD